MAMDEKGLGRRLQDMRRKAHLTQQELCHQANLSFSTLAKIERGAIKSPSIFTIQSIAAALGVSLDELIGLATPTKVGKQYKKSKTGVSFVYFDVNGCLVRFYQRASARLAADYGLSPGLVETAILHYNDASCRGELTIEDFNAAVAQRIGLPTIDWAKYYWEAAEPIIEMHQALIWASEHYRIGLLTNIMPTLLEGLLKLDKVPNVPYDAVINSSAIGMIKPNPQIYVQAAEQAGVPANEILFIDDTQANLVAAEKQDWQVVLFDYARPEESTEHLRAALELAN